jgi:hypothetical protein
MQPFFWCLLLAKRTIRLAYPDAHIGFSMNGWLSDPNVYLLCEA